MTKVKEKTPTTNEMFETNDFSSIMELCKKAQNDRKMIGLIGDTGMGKTTALEAFSKRKNVFYVAYDKTMQPKHFFIALLKQMGIEFEGTINKMVNLIADEINKLQSPLILIDEAGKITHTMILYLHVLHYKTIKNCGFVLAGMPYFKSNLIKFSNKEKEGYAEFFRRVNIWHTLEGLSRAEIKTIATETGVTSEEQQKPLQYKKRFADLMNEIYLINSIK